MMNGRGQQQHHCKDISRSEEDDDDDVDDDDDDDYYYVDDEDDDDYDDDNVHDKRQQQYEQRDDRLERNRNSYRQQKQQQQQQQQRTNGTKSVPTVGCNSSSNFPVSSNRRIATTNNGTGGGTGHGFEFEQTLDSYNVSLHESRPGPVNANSTTATATATGTSTQQMNREQRQHKSSTTSSSSSSNTTRSCHHTLARMIEMKVQIRKRLNCTGTDVAYNDIDPYGDGDQRPITDTKHQYVLHELFYTGGELTMLLNEQNWGSKVTLTIPSGKPTINTTTPLKRIQSVQVQSNTQQQQQTLLDLLSTTTTLTTPAVQIQLGGLSEFVMHCISGHYDKVQAILESKTVKAGCTIDTIPKLIEKRETTLRLSPLLLVIVANTRLSSEEVNNNNQNDTKLKYKDDTSITTIPTTNTYKNNNNNKGWWTSSSTKPMSPSSTHYNYEDESATKMCFSIPARSTWQQQQQQKQQKEQRYHFNSSPRQRRYHNTNNNKYVDTNIDGMCQWSYNQLRVIEVLLEYGARPDARDVCGKTVVHYGAGIDATVMSLLAVDMCCRSYKSSYLYNQEVVLRNAGTTATATTSSSSSTTNYSNKNTRILNNLSSKYEHHRDNDDNVVSVTCMTLTKKRTATTTSTTRNSPGLIPRMLRTKKDVFELNGKQGLAQGYIADTGCRIVYVFGQSAEIRTLKPFQMELVLGNHNTNNNTIKYVKNRNLCNIPDRMGRVPIVEIYDTNRLDVAEFLLLQQKASIYVRTGWNTNRPKQQQKQQKQQQSTDNSSNNHELSPTITDAIKQALSNLSGRYNPDNTSNVNDDDAVKQALSNLSGTSTKKVNNTSTGTGTAGEDDYANTLLYNVLLVREKSSVSQLIYALAVQQIQKEQKSLRNQCSYCHSKSTKTGTTLRVCEQCMSVRFCSTECQVLHWNNGHKYKCKQLAQERNIFVLVTPDILLHRYSYSDNGNNTGGGGSFRKPSGIDYGEPFIVKIQHLQEGGDDILWIYNKERDCEFFLYYDNNASTNHFTTSTGSKNTKQMEANNEHTKGCSDLIDILQSVQPNQQHMTVLSKNNQNASMYITAIFENEHRCKLFIHQTKIKLW